MVNNRRDPIVPSVFRPGTVNPRSPRVGLLVLVAQETDLGPDYR